MNWKKRKKRNQILKEHGLSSWTEYQMMLRMGSEAEETAMFMIRSKYAMKAYRQRLKKDIRNKRIGTGQAWWRYDKYCEFMISMGCSEGLYKG